MGAVSFASYSYKQLPTISQPESLPPEALNDILLFPNRDSAKTCNKFRIPLSNNNTIAQRE